MRLYAAGGLLALFVGVVDGIVSASLRSNLLARRDLDGRPTAQDLRVPGDEDEDEENVSEEVREARRWRFPKWKKFKRKAKKGYEDLPYENERLYYQVRMYFFNGYELNIQILVFNAVTLGVGLLVLILYMYIGYRNDHGVGSFGEQSGDLEKDYMEEENTLSEAKSLFGLLSQDRLASMSVVPDLVLVFDNPGAETEVKKSARKGMCPDFFNKMQKSERITHEALQSVTFSMSQGAGSHEPLPKVKKLLEDSEERGDRSRKLGYKFSTMLGSGDTINRNEAITALIQDLYAWLPGMGFDLAIFRSMDDSTLFFSIMLTKDECITQHLTSQNCDLPILEKVEDELGVGECLDPSARFPPFVRFDPTIVKRLYEQGYIKANDPRELYATHHVDGADAVHVVNRSVRVRMVEEQLEKTINLDAAKIAGLLVDYYPTHSMSALRRLGHEWAALKKFKDLSFVQPVPTINAYFGSRVAFIFAWTGLYCKLFCALVPVALCWELAVAVYDMATRIQHGKKSADEPERAILGFTILVLVWARVASNMWDREQRYFLKQFNLEGDTVRPAVRPEFSGVLQPCPADASLKELQTRSRFVAGLRTLVSGTVTLAFILLVAFCIFLWFRMFNGRLGFVASICLSVQIKIFEVCFNKMSLVLNKFENHKYNTSYYDSLLWKRFLFGFVNSYCAFFYIALMQRFTSSGCRKGGCHHALRVQLTMTLCMLSLVRIATVLFQTAFVRARLYYAERSLQAEHEGQALPKRTFMEEQFQYNNFLIVEQIDYMQALAITLGYVILFGGVAPLTVPFSFAVFIVQLRASSFLLVTSTRQCMPRIALGIGAWRSVVIILMNVGVFFAGFLLAIYSLTFAGAGLVGKLTLLIVFMSVIYACWGVVDFFCPPVGKSEAILGRRRRLVENVMMEATVERPEDRSAREEALRQAAAASSAGETAGSSTEGSDSNPRPEGPSALKLANVLAWRRHRAATRASIEQIKEEAEDSAAVAEAKWDDVPLVRDNQYVH